MSLRLLRLKIFIRKAKSQFLGMFSSRWLIRDWGTNKRGKLFTEEQIQQVWEKAQTIDNQPKEKFRKDVCGAKIQRTNYKNESSHYGWEIDHIIPVCNGGKDNIENLQVLQWRNNRAKGDDETDPQKYCQVQR